MRRTTRVLVCLASFAVVAAATAFATQVEYLSPRQMGDESALVVRGRVASVRSYWNEAHTKIFTEATIQVDETYKGAPTGTARILQMGGIVGNIQMHVYGAIIWHGGQEVLLFLDRLDGGDFRVAGFSQGKFGVERDPVTGEAFIRGAAMEDTEIVGSPTAGEKATGAVPVRMPLEKFVNQALGRN